MSKCSEPQGLRLVWESRRGQREWEEAVHKWEGLIERKRTIRVWKETLGVV